MTALEKILRHPEKIIYGLWRLGLLDWMKEETYLKLVYFPAFRRKLDLRQPKTFTEKLNWYKLYYRDPLMQRCADKWEVRAYVEEKAGTRCLNELLDVWDSVDDMDISLLPDKFVLKPTNGSGDVVICTDKSTFDIEKAKAILCQNQKRHFSGRTKEWAYYSLPFRILGERLIESSDHFRIRDYKFFCFQGEPRFLFVASERGKDCVKFDFFDTEWNYLPVTNGHAHNSNIQKPAHFEEMLQLARSLSQDFPHVRVDLYEEEEKVYFGELTFYHFGGLVPFTPDVWDAVFGEYFRLPDKRGEEEES